MNNPVTIEHRKLTLLEANIIIKEIQNTVNITGYTGSELQKFNNIQIAIIDNNLVGVCINIDINEQWTELAVLLVLPEYRGQGIGKLLFDKSCELLAKQHKNIYTTSRNPIVIKLMERLGFIFLPLQKLPLSIQKFNFKFILNFYRISEFFRKKMYAKNLPGFVYGVKYNQ